MNLENNENIPESYRCWNCKWVIPPSAFKNLKNHTCFSQVNEETHCLVIAEDGLVSFIPLSKGKRKWFQEVRLIKEVSKRPKLYDRRERYAETPQGRRKLWEEVATLFPGNGNAGCSAVALQRSWKNLRGQYSRHDSVKFRHFDMMQFLENTDDEILASENRIEELEEQQSSRNSIVTEETVREFPNIDYNGTLDNVNEDNGLQTHAETDVTQTQHSAKKSVNDSRRKKTNSNTNKELEKAVLEKIQSFQAKTLDPSEMFLMSLADNMKSLTEKQRLNVQFKILNILMNEIDVQDRFDS